MAKSRPYQTIVNEDLRILDVFLAEHADFIRERLNFAAAELHRQGGEIFAINHCLHVAGSLVLQCAANNLNYALDRVRDIEAFHGKDPTTVLTIAMLYYLLQAEPIRPKDEAGRENLDRLRQRFEQMNWLVGPQGMKALGIGPNSQRTNKD